ncbi:L-type lectin-domain containing receptor kinase S.4 [Vitis vinifera]|uniref:L-type lectin-domain containing receptor kinase S.4 n=1 Tax=Vitis vinifera TaxID=29760 RepID=A0A438GWE9_VITVI|nr:L-type lectin-domain containing receptor kinase S.4 [Vitis vinifera]
MGKRVENRLQPYGPTIVWPNGPKVKRLICPKVGQKDKSYIVPGESETLLITQVAMAVPSPILFFFFFFLIYLAYSDNTQFIFQGFKGTSTANLSLNGASIITSTGAIRLTNFSKKIIGRAFYSLPLHMFDAHSQSASSFSTNFVFAIVPLDPESGGGHGFAFTVAPSKELPGARYENYLGILSPENNGNLSNHIFAVEFDTVRGSANDINGNHVGIDINSMNSTVSKTASYYANHTTLKKD